MNALQFFATHSVFTLNDFERREGREGREGETKNPATQKSLACSNIHYLGYNHCTVNKYTKMNIESVASELECLASVKVAIEGEGRLLVKVAERTFTARALQRASGYPRDARAAVFQGRQALQPGELLLLSAPAFTEASREWLRNEGVGYFDALGNLFLVAEGLYILRESSVKPSKAAAPPETNIFRGKAAQVLQTLLHAPQEKWHLTTLAETAGVASGTALRVCDTLEKMLLMERQGRGPRSLRWLTNPGELLTTWAAKHRLDGCSPSGYYRWMADLETFAITVGKAVEAQGADYAVTLDVAAMRRAPFLAHTEQLALILPEDVDKVKLASDCQLKPVEEGANVLLLTSRAAAPLMYRQKVDGLWLASDIQLYLDLSAAAGRGREQAEHLRRERIGF